MGSFQRPANTPELIEEEPIPDTFITGCMPPEFGGEYVRIVFYAERTAPDGVKEHVKRVSLCMPMTAYKAILRLYYPMQREAMAEESPFSTANH